MLQLQILFCQEQFQVRLFLLPAIPSTPTLVCKESGLSGGEGGVEKGFWGQQHLHWAKQHQHSSMSGHSLGQWESAQSRDLVSALVLDGAQEPLDTPAMSCTWVFHSLAGRGLEMNIWNECQVPWATGENQLPVTTPQKEGCSLANSLGSPCLTLARFPRGQGRTEGVRIIAHHV